MPPSKGENGAQPHCKRPKPSPVIASALPVYWSTAPDQFPSQGWALVNVTGNPFLFPVLQRCVAATQQDWLGQGRDASEAGAYSALQLAAAWRIENPQRWKTFCAARDEVAVDMYRTRNLSGHLSLRTDWSNITAAFPAASDLSINEVLLAHGTTSGTVLAILAGGLNARLSNSGLFGHGTYFCDNLGKADQYTNEDPQFSSSGSPLHELHKRLYRQALPHPTRVRYMFLCRVVLGEFLRTRDGYTSVDHGDGFIVHASDEERELVEIPGISLPVRFHSLIAETGDLIKRYREVVQFHDARILPEYLLAYKRVYKRVRITRLVRRTDLNGRHGTLRSKAGERFWCCWKVLSPRRKS
ncbi:unnamed protein product [Polarella glacialis]|uniref:PARP catalytic domain-containing protein n=1 Tax=Polarella glacialis TaxID=89957 RepID=A0A813F2U9_POLGL|nr:unnamed protein product [Polarella glacialis]CAE8675825.1 unnamed protein product [Polarella glacialis]